MKKLIYYFFEMQDMAPEKKLYWELYFCGYFPRGKEMYREGKTITIIENLFKKNSDENYKVIEFNFEKKTSFIWLRINDQVREIFDGTLSEGLKKVHLA